MKIINSVQLMLIYIAMPFLITWTKDAEFYGHIVAFWVLIVVFFASSIGLTILVHDNLDK